MPAPPLWPAIPVYPPHTHAPYPHKPVALPLPRRFSLEDVVHEDKKLFLVFEFLDLDLKKHMDSHPQAYRDPLLTKVDRLQGSLQGLLGGWHASACREARCGGQRS